MPAASAAAAALLVAFVLWHRQPAGELPLEGRSSPVEDLDLLADGEALDLIEDWDGSFYEWAAAQTDAGGRERRLMSQRRDAARGGSPCWHWRRR